MLKRCIVAITVIALSLGTASADEPFCYSWWCSLGRNERPDMASVNINYDYSVYLSGVLPEVYVYNRAHFLSATGATEAPEMKGLSDLRFVWTSKAVAGNITEGVRVYLGAGCKLPDVASGWSSATANVYIKMKVNETDRLDEVRMRCQTESDSEDTGNLYTGMTDDTFAVLTDDVNLDLSSDSSLYLTVNITGTDTAANVGLTIVDVEYIAVRIDPGT